MNRQRATRIAARWTTELAVVFVGVYAAFAVAEWDEDREREQRAEQIRQALREEIRHIQRSVSQPLHGIPRLLAELDSSLAAGVPVPLEPYLAPAHYRTHVWETTLASGALALLDVEPFYRVSAFYNEFNAFREQIHQRRLLSESQLTSLAGADPETFYEPDPERPGGLRVRPQFAWHTSTRRRLSELARCTTVLGDSALLALGAEPAPTAPPLRTDGC